jgi:hypothetical protein
MSMLRRLSRWPITIGPCLVESARSISVFDRGDKEVVCSIQVNLPLILQQSENSGRLTNFEFEETPIRGSKSIADGFLAAKTTIISGIAE